MHPATHLKRAQKNLAIIPRVHNLPERLNLKKSTIQAIMKKQGWKDTSKLIQNRRKFFRYGICGSLLRVTYDWQASDEVRSRKCPKLMMNNHKMIHTIDSSISRSLSLSLLDIIRKLRNLRFLKIDLPPSVFFELPQTLRHLTQLRNLNVSFGEDYLEKFQNGKKNFSVWRKYLLSEQKLESFCLKFGQKIFPDKIMDEIIQEFFEYLGDCNVPCFNISIGLYLNQTIPVQKAERFLNKIECLWIIDNFQKDLPVKNILCLKEIYQRGSLENFEQVLQACSSLKNLNVDTRVMKTAIPGDVGSAKGIKEVRLYLEGFPGSLQNIQQVSQLLSQSPLLEKLELTLKRTENLLGVHNDVIETLQKSNIKSYTLKFSDHSLKTETLDTLFDQIIKIQSLESLTLNFCWIDSAEGLNKIFMNFPKLKEISLSFPPLPSSTTFPIENMVELKSIEKVFILFRQFDTKGLLEKLPKLPLLKDFLIQEFYGIHNQINIDDYRRKFPSDQN